MKKLFFAILVMLLCMGTAFAQETVYVGEQYSVPSGYTLSVFWPEGKAADRSLLEDIQAVFFTAYPSMRETYGTTDSLNVNIFLADDAQMPENTPAYTTGNSIYCSRSFLEQDLGNLNCIVHELFHVVQNDYPSAQDNAMIAVLCEGLADYARDMYGVIDETDWKLPAYEAGQSVLDSYRVTAAFLKWTCCHFDSMLCLRLNRVLHEGRYSDAFWVNVTGYSLEELWAMYGQL